MAKRLAAILGTVKSQWLPVKGEIGIKAGEDMERGVLTAAERARTGRRKRVDPDALDLVENVKRTHLAEFRASTMCPNHVVR